MSFISIEEVVQKLNIDQVELKKHVKDLKIQVFMAGMDESGKKRVCIRENDLAKLERAISGDTSSAEAQDDDFVIDLGDEEEKDSAKFASSGADADEEKQQLNLGSDEDSDLQIEDEPAASRDDDNEETLQLDSDDNAETQPVNARKKQLKDETLSINMADNDMTLPEDSFSLDDDSLTINDELSKDEDSEASLLLDKAELEQRSMTASGRNMQAKAATKIIDEPNAHFIWSLISMVTFLVIVLVGIVTYGNVKGESDRMTAGLNGKDSFYSGLHQFFMQQIELPKK